MHRLRLLAINCSSRDVAPGDIPVDSIRSEQIPEIDAEADYSGVVVGGNGAREIAATLAQLRSQPSTCLLPIYLADDDCVPHPLADGVVPEDLLQRMQDFQSRRERLEIDPFVSLDNRLLSYLWLVDGRLLEPGKILNDKAIYRYELLELWDPGQSEVRIRLAQRNDLIAAEKVVDRLRLCRSCHSAHLNYIDVCPHCGDIDIVEERAIHCFNCGHVASQERFVKQEKLVCPNCLAQLRHIGSDYDRPIENHRCNHCDQLFIDAKVIAVCLHCDQPNEIDHLQSRTLCSYGLGYNGRYQVREGKLPESDPIVFGAPLGRPHFIWMLRWLNATTAIAEHHHFAIGVRFFNLQGAGNDARKSESVDAFEDLSELVKQLFRENELSTSPDTETRLFLLPFGGSKRVKELAEEIERIESSQVEKTVEIRLVAQELPCVDIDLNPDGWMDAFMSRIRQ